MRRLALSGSVPRVTSFCLSIFAFVAVAAAGDGASSINRDWLLCQAGYVNRCDQLLRSSIDDNTRMLVRVDQQFARERINAHVNLLLGICEAQSKVKACDRALSYDLTSAQRKHILDTRHLVVRRGFARGSR
jgi:hypothetical protein